MRVMCRDFKTLIIFSYILCFKVCHINSKRSQLWKLSPDKTKIIKGTDPPPVLYSKQFTGKHSTSGDPLYGLVSSESFGGSWMNDPHQNCMDCSDDQENDTNSKGSSGQTSEPLDCGKPVNFTYFDNLVGVINRNRHPIVPEPQAAMYFTKVYGKNKHDTKSFDIDALERRLKKAKREKPKSIQLYNQIGNFWRIKGDASKAIECFRRALAASPHNAEVLLSLARMLFSLQYLDDAIYLTRRSLEVQTPEKGAWQQYFTLGAIFKAYGHYQEASIHLRHTLELNPKFEPAQIALQEMEAIPTATIHIYTLVIIVCLIFRSYGSGPHPDSKIFWNWSIQRMYFHLPKGKKYIFWSTFLTGGSLTIITY